MKVENKVANMLNLPSMDPNDPAVLGNSSKTAVESTVKSKDVKAEGKNELKNGFYELDISDLEAKQDFASEFGFRTDEKGFFDERFNMAARLPQSYKIDLENVRAISKELGSKDLLHTINQYYISLSSINPEFKENSTLKQSDIKDLVAGFSSNHKLLKLYKNDEELQAAKEANKSLISLNLHNNITSFHFDKALQSTDENKLLKPFIKEDSGIEKAGLLLNFIRNDLSYKNKNEKFFNPPFAMDSSVLNFDTFIKQDSKDYLVKNNEKTMSFDLYLYMNSVDKNTVDSDKLSLLHDQYLSYARGKNMDEFMQESSIYKDYLKDTSEFLDKLKSDFSSKDDGTNLEKIDEDIRKGNERFINQRSIELKMEKAIKAYINFI